MFGVRLEGQAVTVLLGHCVGLVVSNYIAVSEMNRFTIDFFMSCNFSIFRGMS